MRRSISPMASSKIRPEMKMLRISLCRFSARYWAV